MADPRRQKEGGFGFGRQPELDEWHSERMYR